MNLYLHILLETAWKASIIPLGDDPTFFAMKSFGGYDMWPAFALAVFGGTIGQMFNWWVGRLLIKFPVASTPPRWFPIVKSLFNRYGVFLLVFAWLPLLNLLALAAGFFGTRARIALPLILIGEATHYGWYLI
ncbi:MAG: hypothetical protein KGI29_00640 [Pseudomonadota bacterium]|nr:hypothetical protein [Pseudomonadota bacterium]MDE3038234.1 hypothetical protein [Pseudomonadota bacterium]